MQITPDQLLAEAQAMALELRLLEGMNARLTAENEALKNQIHNQPADPAPEQQGTPDA